jgi:hypothetical protein
MERFHRTIERHFATGLEVSLEIDCRNGNVSVQRRDQPDVRVLAIAESDADTADDAEQDFRAVDAGMRADGGHVRVVAPSIERPSFLFFGRGFKVSYEVSVPLQTRVRATARNGRVEVSGVAGDVRIEDRNGSVLLERVGGPVQVECRNGRIDASDCASSVNVLSRNGHVNVTRPGGDLTAETRNGNVIVHNAAAGVHARSSNGTLHYTGRVGGDVDLEVEANGSIRFAVPSDSRFALDAEAVRGDIKCDLAVREDEASSQPRPSVRLRTVNGSIRIEALEAVS